MTHSKLRQMRNRKSSTSIRKKTKSDHFFSGSIYLIAEMRRKDKNKNLLVIVS